MNPHLPPGWPVGAAKPEDEVAAMFNLAHRSAELNEEATKACAANIAEEELEKETHQKAEAAAILAKVKATPAAVVAVAEATKSAYAATKKTKIAERMRPLLSMFKRQQQQLYWLGLTANKAAAAAAANIAKAAEDEATAKLVQEKTAAAAVLADADAEVINVATNIAAALAKAAEDEAADTLVQEKAAAAAVLADARETKLAYFTAIATLAGTRDDVFAKFVQDKAAAEAAEDDATQAANIAPEEVTKAVEDKTAARLLEEDSVAIVDGMDSAEWTAAVKVASAELKAKVLNKGALTDTSVRIAEEKEVVSSDSDTKLTLIHHMRTQGHMQERMTGCLRLESCGLLLGIIGRGRPVRYPPALFPTPKGTCRKG
eukprot:scaffold40237_cov33-Attheya_sp.AAC.1